MKTRLRILNLLLVIACGFVAWQMRANHVAAEARMERTFTVAAAKASAQAPTVEGIPAAPTAAEYSQVAMRMLFAQDRNPNVVEETKPEPEKKKMPELPIFHGVLNFGDGPIAMLSENAGGKQSGYKAGDTIGEFKVLRIAKEEIAFEWDGQEVVKRTAELKSKEPAAAPRQTASPKPAAVKAEPVKPPSPAKPGPGVSTGGRERACQAGENSPDGTVVDGWVKRTAFSPMGAVCYWEPVGK